MSKEIIITRIEWEKLLTAGFRNGEYSFVESLLASWLKAYPRDLSAELQLARLWSVQRKNKEAIKLVSQILLRDPEFLEAYVLLAELGGNVDVKAVKSFVFVLGGTTQDITDMYPWAVTLRSVRMGIRRNDLESAGKLLTNLLEAESSNPLVALAHSQYITKTQEPLSNLPIYQTYQKKWPDCIQFSLLLADLKIKQGDEAEAIRLLHECASMDPAGQVVKRILGDGHIYASLWVQNQSMVLDIQVPSSVAVTLNWNQLMPGVDDSIDPTAQPFKGQQEYPIGQTERKTEDKSGRRARAGAVPVYVILSSKLGLENKYGEKTAEEILKGLNGLCQVVKQKRTWDAMVFLPDSPDPVFRDEIERVNAVDAWKIKLALNDLDKLLKKQSRMIGAVLIVGGHEIIPFHKLPNPTDDSDDGVLSDNPYSTSSGNYLVPEWPVGRLPDEEGRDAGLLLEQIRQTTNFHQNAMKNRNFATRLLTTLLDRTEIRRIIRDIFSPPKNFGYSAAVWRRSSLSAFRPIGNGASLRITPPYISGNIDIENLMKSKCAYFNLHGLSTTPEWYGQRDFSEEPTGPDFPVAISTREIVKYRNNVDLTFTEACYGGYIVNKKIDDSIALKLISMGSQGLVASTCIAYGSVFPPLIGADLLAFIFWKYIKEGYSFGESLMQAKIGLVKVMAQRQGYLDGEDQKTLESFVLYGDPLGYLEENIYFEKHMPVSEKIYPTVKTFSDQDGYLPSSPRVSSQLMADLNTMVESYIPNLDNAQVKIREHQIRVEKILGIGGEKSGAQTQPESETIQTRTQVTYSQKMKSARTIHEQFARVTLDESGKVIKLAVSR